MPLPLLRGTARTVVLLSACAHALAASDRAAARTLQAGGAAGGQQCSVDPATGQKVADGWCEATCRATPDADWCKGVCICPKLEPAAQPSATPAANKPAAKPTKCQPTAKGSAQKVGDEWCEATCRAAPEVDWCKDVCKCPKLEPAAKPSATPTADKPAAKPAAKPTDRCEASAKGVAQKVGGEWCEATCRTAPDVDWCKDVCICPSLEATRDHARAETLEPPPPHPRILGGWTDCGPNSGASDMAQRRSTEKLRMQDRKWDNGKWDKDNGAHKKVDKFGNCSKDEEEILAALSPDHRIGDIRREPSYSHAWGANAILPGRFGGSEIAPIIGEAGSYKYFWLTFGGQNTDSSNWMARAEQDIVEAGAMGAAFDIEGGVYPRDMVKWVKEMRVKHPHWSYVHVPQADDTPIKYDPEGGSPDYVAPMMYYGNYNSYPKMDVSDVAGVGASGRGGGESLHALKELRAAGWPASRTILTYQSFDAARIRTGGDKKAKVAPNSDLLKLLGKLLGNHSFESKTWGSAFKLQGPYAGVLGWPAQCGKGDNRCWPEADEANLRVVIDGARSVGVEFASGV